jgi:centriolar protein POC1
MLSTNTINQNIQSSLPQPLENESFIPQPSFLRLLKYHTDTISAIAFNSNNKQLMSSSFDNRVMVWDLTSLKNLPSIGSGHTSLINDLSIAPNGFLFASASSDHTVRLWSNTYDYSSQNRKIQSQVLKFHSAPVKSVDFSCDSRLITSCSDDETVKIIGVADKRLKATLTGHKNWVKTCRFSKDAKLIASGSDDKTLRLWDVQMKKQAYCFENEHKGAVNCVRFHPDNSCIATACFDSKIRLFDVRSKRTVQIYSYHTKPATCVAFHPSGMFLSSTSYDGTIKIYDLRIGDILFTLNAHESAVMSCAFSQFGDYFASGGLDSQIVIWKSNLESYSNLPERIASYNSEYTESPSPTSSKPFNSETGLNYKKVGSRERRDVSEGLTNVFDKMVSQMDMITSSFVNFEKRISKMEEMVDEMNEEDEKNMHDMN